MTTPRGLMARLENGENIIIAEGYMWEFERRGYLKGGGFIPEVVLEHPDKVRSMHEEFAHAGSDVLVAFTYYGHREKLRLIGREDDLENLNRGALKIAREVANETGTLMAGGLCNTGIYQPDEPQTHVTVRNMFKEQVEWAVEEGADFVIGETFDAYGEAKIALDVIKEFGRGLPAVISFVPYIPDSTTDDIYIPDACRLLEEAGAAMVGINCGRGPRTMVPLLREIRKLCKGPIGAVPVPFRTRDDCRTFQSLKDPETGKWLYPMNMSCTLCSREDIRKFAEEAKEIGVNYIGVCCGNSPAFTREVAEVFGRNPEASKYSPDMSLNYIFGKTKKTEKYGSGKLRDWMIGKHD